MPFSSNSQRLVIVLSLLVVITIDKLGIVNIFEDVQNIRFILNIDGFIAIVTNLYLGNATKNANCGNITKRVFLELGFENPTDGFENPLGSEDPIEGTPEKNTYDHTTENKKDEEMNRLWALLCPKKGQEKLNIVQRYEWGSQQKVVRQRRSQAADFLIVDASGYTYIMEDYFASMHLIESYELEVYGDLTGNFYIADDGGVFEGIGWNHFNYMYNGGLGPKSLVIVFIVKEGLNLPSATAIMAFRQLVRIAVCAKELSTHYSLIPFYLIYDIQSLSSQSFERKEMREWDRYRDNLDFLFPLESEENVTQPIVSRFEWSDRGMNDDLMTLSSPIEYVLITYFGPRCFFNCRDHLKVLERDFYHKHMQTNFIVAEDGRAYEAKGWHKTWNVEYQEKKAVVVAFLGYFNSYIPHKNIFLALKGVIEEGKRLRKLSKSYQMLNIFDSETV